MRIIEQRVEWITPNIQATEEASEWADEALQAIARGARNCYKSEDIGFDRERNSALVTRLIKSGHESVLEHVQFQFRVITNRGVSHQWVRHRVGWSYSQESTRYCNYSKDKFGNEITVIWPWYLGKQEDAETSCKIIWKEAMENAEYAYFNLLEHGCTPDEARDVLPHSLKTEIVCSCNLRSLRHFLYERLSAGAHAQIKALAKQILLDIYKLEPSFVQDIAKEIGLA